MAESLEAPGEMIEECEVVQPQNLDVVCAVCSKLPYFSIARVIRLVRKHSRICGGPAISPGKGWRVEPKSKYWASWMMWAGLIVDLGRLSSFKPASSRKLQI